MPASVPGLGKDPGINALTFEGEAGFSPIVYEGRKACPADETLLIVMITHSRSIAQTADRVLQVSDGVLTDFGRCAE